MEKGLVWSNIMEDEYATEVEVPDCFSYHDEIDPACRRCPVIEQCKEEQQDTRPPCFGVGWKWESEECESCIDESVCREIKESEMTKRKIKIRQRRRRPVPKPEPEPEVEEEAEEAAEGYSAWTLAELREELEDRGLEPSGRKSVLMGRLMDDDETVAPGRAVDDEPEPEPEPVVRTSKPRRRVRKVKPEPEPEEEAVAPVPGTLAQLFDQMAKGQVLTLIRVDENAWQFSGGAAVAVRQVEPAGKGLRGDAFYKEACTPEYYEFYYVDAGDGKAWEKMKAEEKVDYVDDLGVKWDEHDDLRVNAIRMTRAIYDELGIKKYKPEYKSKAARSALR